MNGISVVIPVYRSSSILPNLLARLDPVLAAIAVRYEVIMVCDGSPDQSWEVICRLASAYPCLRGYNLRRNYGQHNAILVGVRAAKFECIVTMDDDLQHPPEEIHKLLAVLNQGYDVVYGTPTQLKHGRFRNLSSTLTKSIMSRSMGYDMADKINAFRAFRTDLRNSFANYHDRFVSIDVLLTWATNKFSSADVEHQERKVGASGYNLRKLLIHAMNTITSFSSVPLQIASLMGFIFMGFGVLVFIYLMINYLRNGGAVPGFTFLASLIAIFSGVQLFSLGIIGEYLARIHFRSMGQPYAIVTATTDDPNLRH